MHLDILYKKKNIYPENLYGIVGLQDISTSCSKNL